jgi:hypothetical protein
VLAPRRSRDAGALIYFSGIGVARSMGTAVMLFLGEPSTRRSE